LAQFEAAFPTRVGPVDRGGFYLFIRHTAPRTPAKCETFAPTDSLSINRTLVVVTIADSWASPTNRYEKELEEKLICGKLFGFCAGYLDVQVEVKSK
jgi:hypothetical protein